MRRFDPWHSGLCTCPAKYSLSPYTGCGHSCVYCYITSYVPSAFKPRAKRDVFKRVSRDVDVIDKRLPILMSASSDPYTPMEGTLNITREILRILTRAGTRFMIQTKSDLVLRDADIISSAGAVVGMTVTTLDPVAERIEPNAPDPKLRLEALKRLSEMDVPTVVRIDPIILGINDAELSRLVQEIASSNVKHVVASTYKARPDSLKRISRIMPRASSRLERLYREEGTRVSNCLYLDEGIRRATLNDLRALVLEHGMTFSTCREGFDELRTSKSCDGTHLIK
ncbi:MAG TPA: radical SAM protein [Thermoproteota archaeon]|nr:radical SAM protein [Thermoproteota archaeon]